MNTIRQVGSDYEIQVCHPNGEIRWLPIESWAERWICVRWGVAGVYDIMLKDGRLIARSVQTKKKYPHNPWKVADKLEARDFVAERMGISKEDIERTYVEHARSMPKKCEVRSVQPRRNTK